LNGNRFSDLLTGPEARAGAVADWLKRTRDNLVGAKDWSLELTLAVPGSALWLKMKENAQRASAGGGGMQVVAKSVTKALAPLSAADRQNWELHVVGHSAGSIFAADALALLTGLGINFKTVQFMAPAVTVKRFKDAVMPSVKAKKCPTPLLYILSDAGERDDVVGPYGKSLLYLVSNAFEGARGTPLLGMQKFIMPMPTPLDPVVPDPDIEKLLNGRIVVAGEKPASGTYPYSESDSHGGFDNDAATMNSVMWHILGADPKKTFTSRDLQY
jgi:hypothetical protein